MEDEADLFLQPDDEYASTFPPEEEDNEEFQRGQSQAGVESSAAAAAVESQVASEVEADVNSSPTGIQLQSMEAEDFTTTAFLSSTREDEDEDGTRAKSKSPSFATPESCPPSSNSSEHESSPMPKHPQQQRFLELQAFLKLCDEADQKDLLEALRSLSAAARSGHAVNLEYRALMLSIEEGKEMLRLKMLNVMGKGKEAPAPEPGTTPVGVRLPAPGSVTDLSEETRGQHE